MESMIINMEKAKIIFRNALNQVVAKTSLPGFLVEGLILDLLAEVRSQKAVELIAEYEKVIQKTHNSTSDQDNAKKREEETIHE